MVSMARSKSLTLVLAFLVTGFASAKGKYEMSAFHLDSKKPEKSVIFTVSLKTPSSLEVRQKLVRQGKTGLLETEKHWNVPLTAKESQEFRQKLSRSARLFLSNSNKHVLSGHQSLLVVSTDQAEVECLSRAPGLPRSSSNALVQLVDYVAALAKIRGPVGPLTAEIGVASD